MTDEVYWATALFCLVLTGYGVWWLAVVGKSLLEIAAMVISNPTKLPKIIIREIEYDPRILFVGLFFAAALTGLTFAGAVWSIGNLRRG